MEFIPGPIGHHQQKLYFPKVKSLVISAKEKSLYLINKIRSLGSTEAMEEYEQRKLSIFNQLNFLQLITSLFIPFIALFNINKLPDGALGILCLPALVSLLVLYLTKKQKHEFAFATYFLLYPFVTCVVYMNGMNLGIGLFFVLYGILSVFFLKDIGYMIFSLLFSLVSYFLLAVVIKHYSYELQQTNNGLYLFNQGLAIAFIFYGLFLIKKENSGYQVNILSKNAVLLEKNEQIQLQSDRINKGTSLLKKQASELGELNSLKNKMFSIISHDLKAPMYALRNLFRNVQEKKMSATELKNSVPDILNDLNYTVGLMDNLLQWAKGQMQADHVNPEEVDIEKSIDEVLQLLNLQAKTKKIHITNNTQPGIVGFIDRNINILVLRNLISNAIKFTPEKGKIIIGVHEHFAFIEVYVKDSGTGISEEAMHKINSNNFYSTKGTASESGTGLGLMLCKEFLAKNGSKLFIESEPGAGSTFGYSIPKSA